MKRLWDLLFASRLSVLIRLACVCAALSLLFMVLLVVVRIPLVTVLGMGVAHGFGILGVLLFAIAVVRDAMRSTASRMASMGPAPANVPPPSGPAPEAPPPPGVGGSSN